MKYVKLELKKSLNSSDTKSNAVLSSLGMRLGLFTACIMLFLLPTIVSAQSLDGLGNTSSFSVTVLPQYPKPMSPATLSFLSSMIDLANTSMTVSVGGKQTYAGSVQPVTIMLGRAGSPTSVVVTMTSLGVRYTQTVIVQPEDVSLIAEPLSSAPALYPGKPQVPLEGSTRVVALASFADASGRTLDPSTLSYTWTVDGAEIANSSGIGKQAVIVASPIQYRTRDVSVLVQSQAGNLVGQDSFSLNPKDPSVRIYANDPLLGIRFEHALAGSYSIGGTEASLYAAPFSFPLAGGAPILQWFLNGTKTQTGNLITLRPTGSGQGSASLSLTATGNANSFTAVNTSLSIIFGAKPSTNFFGL